MVNCRRALSLIVLLGLGLFFLGCSKSYIGYYPVTGMVFYNDKPVTAGVVMFQPPSGPPASGQIQPDGSFELETYGRAFGARTGANQVRISHREMKQDGGELALGKYLLPERYSQFSTSGLNAEVKAGENEPFEFRLTD